jgi:hypothetical protein
MRIAYSFLWKTLRLLQLHRVPALFEVVFPNEVSRKVGAPLVVANTLEPKYTEAWKCLVRMGIELGDYLEFGVSRGTTMACMHRVVTRLKLEKVRLFGFDAFEDTTLNEGPNHCGSWNTERAQVTIEQTKRYLTKVNTNWGKTSLIKGKFDDTLNSVTTKKLALRKASIIMIDCRTYAAARAALDYSMPLMVDFTIIFFDNWYDEVTVGGIRAFSEFLNDNQHLESKEFGAYLPNGRIFLVINLREES